MVQAKETPKPEEGPPSEAVEQAQGGAEVTKEARTWAMFCHLAGLCGFILPFVGNIVGPLILWQLKKDEYPFVDQHGKEALNFQLSMTIYGLVSMVLIAAFCIGAFLLAAVVIVDLVFLLVAGVKANNGLYYRYPLTIRFVK